MKILQKIFCTKKHGGFTILELLVSVALFTIVSVTVTGITLSLSKTRDIAKQKETLRGELRAVMDTLGRETTWTRAFQTGCETGCNAGANPLTFITRVRPDTPEKQIIYKYDAVNKTIIKTEERAFPPCNVRTDIPAECSQKMLSDQTKIENMEYFTVNNADDSTQVTLTMVIKGYFDLKGRRENFSVSSSFTPRLLQSQEAFSGSDIVVPEWVWVQQICYRDNPSFDIYGQWADDQKYWMHIERCMGINCTNFALEEEADSRYNDSFLEHGTAVGQTYRYRLQLHDHTQDIYGDYSEIRDVTLQDPSVFGKCGAITPGERQGGGKGGKGGGKGKHKGGGSEQ